MSLWEPPNLGHLRVSYLAGSLDEGDVAADPRRQFEAWLADATEAGLPEPNAMVLATADSHGHPTTRTVLLKGVDDRGFSFFTNYTSRKGRQLAENPHASVCFPWFAMHRQVTVTGIVEMLPTQESEGYFRSRPRGSQLAAWASHQSAEIPNRDVLEARYSALERRWPGGTAPTAPNFWGGYLLIADSVEFWHGRESRMHDRIRYVRDAPARGLGEPSAWAVKRISP